MHSYNQFIYSRERRRFGRQCLFSDRTQPLLSIQTSQRLRMSYILRNPVDSSTQLSDQKAYSIVETENVTFTEHGMYHYEGGWPREVNINDEEATLRHRKKVEREDAWGIQVNNLIHSAMEVAAQNSAVNIYEEFFVDLPPELGHEIRMPFEARQMNIFHDPVQPPRPITNIDWSPSEMVRFLELHTKFRIEPDSGDKKVRTSRTGSIGNLSVGGGDMMSPAIEPVTGSDNAFYAWNQKNPLKAISIFESAENVRKASYCPKDDNFITGGFESGKVGLWDARIAGLPIHLCPLEAAHRDAVSAICWVHSKSNSEFYTGSNDGTVKYWDGRDLQTPLQEVLLDPEPTDDQLRERAHGVTVLEFEYTIPVRYIIASDQGHVFICNRKGLLPTETLLSNYRLFSGPIRTVERNPFFVKNFLITGDWCAKIWAEECKGAPSTFFVKKKNQILCGTWSTARCSLFVTGDAKGELDFWDLLLHQRKPIFTMKLNNAITYVKFRPDGIYLAVGLSNGDVHMLELDDALKRSAGKDKPLMAALFEREQLRCKLLEGRVEEIKLKRKTSAWEAEKMALAAEQHDPMEDLDPNDPDQFLQIIENDTEFKAALHIFKDLIFKVEKKRQERVYVMERTDFEVDYVYEDEEPLEDQPTTEPVDASKEQQENT